MLVVMVGMVVAVAVTVIMAAVGDGDYVDDVAMLKERVWEYRKW